MERKRNHIEKVQDWADDHLRRMCGRITPGKRLAVILVMFFFFGGLSIYITVSSIYNIGKRDGQRLQIEHIRQLPLHGNDTTKSINPLNRPQYGRHHEDNRQPFARRNPSAHPAQAVVRPVPHLFDVVSFLSIRLSFNGLQILVLGNGERFDNEAVRVVVAPCGVKQRHEVTRLRTVRLLSRTINWRA